jgi:hypothetical protein
LGLCGCGKDDIGPYVYRGKREREREKMLGSYDLEL